jgi:hypothetical protein
MTDQAVPSWKLSQIDQQGLVGLSLFLYNNWPDRHGLLVLMWRACPFVGPHVNVLWFMQLPVQPLNITVETKKKVEDSQILIPSAIGATSATDDCLSEGA